MEDFKTKKIDFIVSPEIRNEFIRLSKSKNVCINDFIEEFIKQYFRNEDFSRLFGYVPVNARSFPDYDENFYNINKALTNEEMREIFQNKKPKINYIYFKSKTETSDKVSDFCLKKGINLCYFLYFILSEKPFYLKRAEKDVVFKSKINDDDDDDDDDDLDDNDSCESVFNLYYTDVDDSDVDDSDVDDSDERDSDERDLGKSNKRGRPSRQESLYKFTDNKRVVNSFSDLRINDLIYLISNDTKKRVAPPSNDFFLLPNLQKIKIHSIEKRGKSIMINRKHFNSYEFELELTMDEYYNDSTVTRKESVYSCLESEYEKAKIEMKEKEIELIFSKINELKNQIKEIRKL
jgi:hypothetical protein